MIAWALVGLLLGALIILWTLSKARVYGLEEDLDAARDNAEALEQEIAEQKADLVAQIQDLVRQVDALPPLDPVPVPPPTVWKPKWRRDIIHHSGRHPTPRGDKVSLARLAMDCALFHPEDCDCLATCRLIMRAFRLRFARPQHESAGAEEA